MSTDLVKTEDRCPCGSGKAYEDCCEGREDLDDMLEEWMENGYRLLREQDDEKRASVVWWETWQVLRSDLPRSLADRKSIDENEYDFDFYVENWVSDFARALYSRGMDDDDFAELGIEFNKQALERFSDDSDRFLVNRMQDLSRLQQNIDRREEARETAQALIDQYPDKGGGYASLADVYVFTDEPDYERAVGILEEALEQLSEDEAEAYGIESRVQDYRDKIS